MMKKLTAGIVTLALVLGGSMPAVWADSTEVTPTDPSAVVTVLETEDAAEAIEETALETKAAGVIQLRDELNQLRKERREHRRIAEDLSAKAETIGTLKAEAKENGEIRKLEKARDIEKEIHQIMDRVEKVRVHKNGLWSDFNSAFKAGQMNKAEQILQNIVRDKTAINTLLHGVEKLMNAEIVILK